MALSSNRDQCFIFIQKRGLSTSCVDTAQQNGRVERKHKHILNVARALRFQAHLPLEFWGECVLIAAYLINRTPRKILKGQTLYEVLFGVKPSYDNLKVLGSLCFAHLRSKPMDKFASWSRKWIFVGYLYGKKGWKVYDLETHEIFVSRDVIFHEHIFPFTPTDDSTTQALDEACVTARNLVFGTLGPYEEAPGKTGSMMQPFRDSFLGPFRRAQTTP